MGPVVSAKLGEYISDVALDGVLCDGKPSGDLFVRVPCRDQPEDIDLARRQRLVRGMVRQLGGDLRGYTLLTRMDGTDGAQKFSVHVSLQYVSPRTSFKSPQNLDVARVRRQDNYAGIGEFSSNADDCLDAVQGRHLKIHQREIRPVQSELFDRFLS